MRSILTFFVALGFLAASAFSAFSANYIQRYNSHTAVRADQIQTPASTAKFKSPLMKEICLKVSKHPVTDRLCGNSPAKLVKGNCGASQGSDSRTYVFIRYQQFDEAKQAVKICGNWYSLDQLK